MSVPGYDLIRADHPSNTKGGRVCIKESLPLRLYNVSYLGELICFEIMFSNKFFNFKSLYISPSQSSDEFENFVYNLDLRLEAYTQKSPFLIVIIGVLMLNLINGVLIIKQQLKGPSLTI